MNEVATTKTAVNPILTAIQTKNTKVYISGPMTGIPNLNKELFDKAEDAITRLGLMAVNPHVVGAVDIHLKGDLTPDEEWAYFMKKDMAALINCGCIVMLPNWTKSVGAIFEFITAKTLKIPVLVPQNYNYFLDKTDVTPILELLNLTTSEMIELFYNITEKITQNDISITNKLLAKSL